MCPTGCRPGGGSGALMPLGPRVSESGSVGPPRRLSHGEPRRRPTHSLAAGGAPESVPNPMKSGVFFSRPFSTFRPQPSDPPPKQPEIFPRSPEWGGEGPRSCAPKRLASARLGNPWEGQWENCERSPGDRPSACPRHVGLGQSTVPTMVPSEDPRPGGGAGGAVGGGHWGLG